MNRRWDMLRAAIPFFEPPYADALEVAAQLGEVQDLLSGQKERTELSICGSGNRPVDIEGLFKAIRKFGSDNDRRMVDMFLNFFQMKRMMDMVKMMQTMQEMEKKQKENQKESQTASEAYRSSESDTNQRTSESDGLSEDDRAFSDTGSSSEENQSSDEKKGMDNKAMMEFLKSSMPKDQQENFDMLQMAMSMMNT